MIYLAADHAGFELKEAIKPFLIQKGLEVEDLGAHSLDKSDDYPNFGYPAAKKVAESGGDSRGILFCGSAEGICIVANKVKGVRAVAVTSPEIARQSRLHNDANVLCLGGGQTLNPIGGLSVESAKEIVETWLATPFSGEERHVRRLGEIKEIEEKG
jgi:ribose 5-phosphate isomerase B